MASFLKRPPFGRSTPSLALLAAVTMTGTVALHIVIPALPAIARDLGAAPATVQLTITLYLLGLAAGQLVYGPVSDRLGRRPVLLASLSLYLLGILLAIPADTVGWLVGARVLQSLGACGALVLGRAMVRDASTSETAAKNLAVLITCMTLTPALAPGLGGLIEPWFGWRAIFVALAGIVGILALLVLLTLPETHLRAGAPLARFGYRRVLRSAKFRRYLLAGSCSGTSLFAFLAVAPFLYIDVLHRSAQEVGLFCVMVSFGMATGAATVRVLIGRLEIRRGARLGNLVSLGAALALLAVAAAGVLSPVTLTATMIVYAFGVGIGGPNILAGAMNVHPEAAGTASGLYGFSQMALGAALTLAVGLWHDGTALPLAVVLVGATVASTAALQRV